MARRSKKSGKNGKMMIPVVAGLVVVLGGLIFVLSGGTAPSTGNGGEAAAFNIADYRQDASRLTGNSYRIEGRIENIETLNNDRLVAVSIQGNKQERLPLLVRSGVAGKVNLTRGDTFFFEVDCRTGMDEDGEELKGILVVRKVETK